MSAQSHGNKMNYAELAAEPKQRSWNTKVSSAEVGCRGFLLLREVTKRIIKTPAGLDKHQHDLFKNPQSDGSQAYV